MYVISASEASQNLLTTAVKHLVTDIIKDLNIYKTLQTKLKTVTDLLNSPLPNNDNMVEALDIVYHEVYTKLLMHKANIHNPLDSTSSKKNKKKSKNGYNENIEISYLEEILELLENINPETSVLRRNKYIETGTDEENNKYLDINIEKVFEQYKNTFESLRNVSKYYNSHHETVPDLQFFRDGLIAARQSFNNLTYKFHLLTPSQAKAMLPAIEKKCSRDEALTHSEAGVLSVQGILSAVDKEPDSPPIIYRFFFTMYS